MMLVNGEKGHYIDASDRGLQYGDGLFETIEVFQGKPVFFDRHLKRLQLGCERLLIPFPDISQIKAEAQRLCSEVDRAVLKLILTRGVGGRGYRQPDAIQPTRILSLHPFPLYPDAYHTEGVVVRCCRQRLAANPLLAGMKHLNRLEQVLARAEWRDDSVQEGLMLDYDDHVIEGTMSNLFVVKQGVLSTPSLNQSGILGIVRELVIELVGQNGLKVIERLLTMRDVLQADELFITNSVIGVWPVRQLDQQCFNVGHTTGKIQQWYAQARMTDTKNG